MAGRSRLTDLSLADLRRLDAVRLCLDAADDAVKASNMHGKPAVRELLAQAYHQCGFIMRKGARQACVRLMRGGYHRKRLDDEFPGRFIGVTELELQIGGGAGEASAVANTAAHSSTVLNLPESGGREGHDA